MPQESFANAVRDKLAFLLTEHGFRIVHEDEHCVRLEAVSLSAEAVLDPRGEVDVNVFRRGRAGYVLRVREPGHRMVRTPGLDVHVHIWPDGDPAVTAYLAFRNRLRSSIADRDLYAATKRRLAQQDWPTMDHYADAKSDVILQILSRTNS